MAGRGLRRAERGLLTIMRCSTRTSLQLGSSANWSYQIHWHVSFCGLTLLTWYHHSSFKVLLCNKWRKKTEGDWLTQGHTENYRQNEGGVLDGIICIQRTVAWMSTVCCLSARWFRPKTQPPTTSMQFWLTQNWQKVVWSQLKYRTWAYLSIITINKQWRHN